MSNKKTKFIRTGIRIRSRIIKSFFKAYIFFYCRWGYTLLETFPEERYNTSFINYYFSWKRFTVKLGHGMVNCMDQLRVIIGPINKFYYYIYLTKEIIYHLNKRQRSKKKFSRLTKYFDRNMWVFVGGNVTWAIASFF